MTYLEYLRKRVVVAVRIDNEAYEQLISSQGGKTTTACLLHAQYREH